MKTFANLNKLTIHEENGLGRDISRYDYIVHQCPTTLRTFSYNAGCDSAAYKYDSERQLTISTMEPQPNNTVKELDVTVHCRIEEGSVNYIMKNFRGLEQMKMAIWEVTSCKLPEELKVEFFQYISGVSKYAIKEYVRKGNESGITDLVTNFMELTSKIQQTQHLHF